VTFAHFAGYTSAFLIDPLEQLKYHTGRAAKFNMALAQLFGLSRDNPTHSGLAQVMHYLPGITVVENVVLPCPAKA
jgi:hypothetical protein